ncbi:MAG: hypothetical protein RIR18_2389 [Pseudomonadota bacterium]|jgi:hypothetical protein
MDISSIASAASGMSKVATSDAVGVAVLRKALDTAANSATQLIESIPKAPSNPAHLGNNVDVSA